MTVLTRSVDHTDMNTNQPEANPGNIQEPDPNIPEEPPEREQFLLVSLIVTLVVFFALVVVRVISMVYFTVYDTKCMIFERASVVDCHQDGLWPDPESWILAWMFLSFSSSLVFFIIFSLACKLGLLEFYSETSLLVGKRAHSYPFFFSQYQHVPTTFFELLVE